MDLFVNKLRNTVSQVAYQVNSSVNTIIPGNPVHRDYELLRFRCSHGCPGFVWSVYDAVKRDAASIKASLKDAIGNPNLIPIQANDQNSPALKNDDDKKLYSVFVFDKSQIDNLAKSDREAALEHVKKGAMRLTRIRHPAVLTVHHQLEESRSTLAFVTEHVYGHLEAILKEQSGRQANSMKQKSNNLVDLSQDLGPKDSDYKQGSCELDDIQIKAGLLQICDGLKFLHSAKMLHRNLCLDNIFVDSNNTWKLAGFDFCCDQLSLEEQSLAKTPDFDVDITGLRTNHIELPKFQSLKSACQSLPSAIVPNWSCSAPEHSNSDHVNTLSDIYSLGMLSCALLGKSMDPINLSYEYGLMSDTYKRGIRLRELADRLPSNYKTIIMKYAAINADSRPSLDDYLSLAIFNNNQVQVIRDLDSQLTWDRMKKIDFFNRLRETLPELSHQVKVNRIATALVKELINPDITPFVLPCILLIARDTTPIEFKTRIFPHLKGPFRILEPRAVPILLLDNLLILADRAKNCLEEFQQLAFTLIQYLLRMDEQMQQKCLVVLPSVKRYIDETSLTTMLLPEISRVHKETTLQATRIQTLDCIKELVEIMSERVIINHVIPILFGLSSREAQVVMSAVNVVRAIIDNNLISISKETLACKILPFLIPLTVEKELDLHQFDTLTKLIKLTMDRIEREQREILGRKSKIAGQKSGALVLNNFKGANHFIID